MARYAYDVNTTQRYIDVHKQFQGGLKTVDTDDALGAVFLRDAQNISLSEFGFIEKRYGTYENFKTSFPLNIIDANANLQGYWEFLGKYIVVAVNGNLYWQSLSTPENTFIILDKLYKKSNLKYPETLVQHFSATEDEEEYLGGFNYFQTTRPMGAVNIANVLYVFTGHYPIYIVEEDNTLKAYLFSKEDPNYAELIVTGHNLLEDDYDNLYYDSFDALEPIVSFIPTQEDSKFSIIDDNYKPRIPYAKDGNIEFNFSYQYAQELSENFVFNTTTQPTSVLNEVKLNKIQYRPAGPGATDLSFVDFDASFYKGKTLNNIYEDIEEELNVISTTGITGFNEVVLNHTDVSAESVFDVPVNYWGSRITSNLLADLKKEQKTDESFLTIKTRDIEIEIDDIAPFETVDDETPGSSFAFFIKDDNGEVLDIEDKNAEIRDKLLKLRAADTREFSLDGYAEGFTSNTGQRLIDYYLWYTVGDSRLLLYYDRYVSDINDTSLADLEWTLDGNKILVSLWKERVNEDAPRVLQTPAFYITYEDTDGSTQDLLLYDLIRAYPLNSADRTTLTTLTNKSVTKLKLYNHNSANDHSQEELLKEYTIGVDLEYRNGYYIFTLPENLPPNNFNHYTIVFTTTEFSSDRVSTDQTQYFNQVSTESKFIQPSVTTLGNTIKYLYPNISQFSKFNDRLPELSPTQSPTPMNYNYTISTVTNISTLQREGEFGSEFLNVKILDNLLSGIYDFKFIFELSRSRLNYATLTPSELEPPLLVPYIVKDITITEEKLQDYTFFQGDRAKPIWSCNNVIEHFNKLMVWGSTEMPTALFYSFPDRPFYFPSKFYLEFTNEEDKPLVNVTQFMNILVAQTEDQTWGIRGNSGLIDAPSPYAEFSINNTVGTIAPKSVRPVRNHLFFLSKQGVIALKSLYAADEQYNIEFVDRNIRNIVPQDSEAVGIQFDNQYWLNFPNDRITLRWYIDKKAWVKDKYDAWVGGEGFKGVFKYLIKDGKLEFITKPSRFTQNENLAIYKIGVDYSLPTDLGDTIFTKFETSYLNQNYPFHPKNYKEAKFDFTLQNEYNNSRDTIYEMETSEHITDGTTHKIDNVTLTKNHRYRIVYSFSEHNADEDITSGGDFTGLNVPVNIVSGGDFGTAPTIIFGAITFSLLGADDLQITSVILTDKDNNQTVLLPNEGFDIIEKDNFDYYVEFLLPNSIDGIVDIIVTGEFSTYNDGAVIYDITYDSELRLYNWIISEDQTLNLDNLSSYDQSKAEFNIDFNSRLGTWVFGTSDFGNKVTAVKTEKLSGKGYNAKVYMEDYSKSKWTLESLGLTYKMKRARSR